MKILILVGIVAFIAFSVWYAKRNGATAEYKSESKKFLPNKTNQLTLVIKLFGLL